MHTDDTSRPQGYIRQTVDRSWIIPFMILGYIWWWPVGLVLTFYMIWGDRMISEPLEKLRLWEGGHTAGRGKPYTHPGARSGNAAFDAYRDDVLARLEREQADFDAFLERLRQARDKAEFDDFMSDRARVRDDESK